MTAYLKAHYKVEFMAALLSSDITGRNFKRKDSLVEHIEDCQRMDITVLPPDVNRSGPEFTVAEGKICFGLSAIKGCGAAAATALEAERERPRTLSQPVRFLRTARPRHGQPHGRRIADQGRRVRFALAPAGRSCSRRSIAPCKPAPPPPPTAAAARWACSAATRTIGPTPLRPILPDVPAWNERERLAKEKEVLGFYLSSHPLAEHQKTLAAYCSHTTVEAAELSHRTEVMLGGILSAIKVAAHEEPEAGQPQPLRHVRPRRHRGHHALRSSGPSSSPHTRS